MLAIFPRSPGNNGHSLDLCAVFPHSLHFDPLFPALLVFVLAFEAAADGLLAVAALAFFSSFFFPFLPVCFALPVSDAAGEAGEEAGAGRANKGVGLGAFAAGGGLLMTCFT